MSTTYTGSPTATQSPASPPNPGVAPELVLPADGDPDNAASVAQAFKVLADYEAWMMNPRGQAPASPGGLDAAYATATAWWRNVRLQRRDFIDHRGFANMARITRWQENWDDVGFTTKTSGGPDANWFRRWLYSITVGSGSPQILTQPGTPFPPGPGTPSFNGGTLILSSGAVSGASCLQLVEGTPSSGSLVTEDTDMAMQTEGALGSGGAQQEIVFGLSPGVSGATGLFASTSPAAAGIMLSTSHANPQLYTCVSGGSPSLVDLGAGAQTVVRWRVEIVGANASDDSNARVIVYGDGSPLANVAVDFAPVNPSNRVFWTPFFRNLVTGGNSAARFGVVDFAAARYAGDITY